MLLQFTNHKRSDRAACRRKKKYDLEKEEGWDKLRAHVAGEIGRHDYDNLTFKEVSLIIDGYSERLIHDYRNTRLIMYMMAKMWGDPKKTPATPEELWKLPGDAVTGYTEEDIAQIFANLRSKEKND